MIAANKKILVRCDLSQKDFMQIGGVTLKRGNEYDKNYRERSPVIAQILEHINDELRENDIILAHHNTFYPPSPFFVKEDIFSIPFNNKMVFAKIDGEGNPQAIAGTIIGEQIEIPSKFNLPPEFRKKYVDRIVILNDSYNSYKKGQIVFVKPYSPYEIVYVFNGIEKRIVKINSEMIVGKLVEN